MEYKIAREKIMRVVFQMDAHNTFDYKQLHIIKEDEKILKNKRAIKAFELINEHINEIDYTIKCNTSRWSIDRISKTELAILRTAVCEMLYMDDIPIPVSINEAVDIAKKYGNERSYAFVNAVLRKIGDKIG